MRDKQLVAGSVTPEGSRNYQQRAVQDVYGNHPLHFYETPDGLVLTKLGMGTYLGEADEETSALVTDAAVESVLSGAVNVLDTAINYRYQLGERAIGEALRRLAAQGISREMVFVCSKNGYLAPDADNQEPFREYLTRELIEPGIIQPEDIVGGMHCMAPGYLEHQLQRSLENLGLETLDLMYLHNAAESQLPIVGVPEFMARLRAAFEFYESARQRGLIRYYGLATWDCFRAEPGQPAYLSLETVVKLAEDIGGATHGFRFIQLPYNLAFAEAVAFRNQSFGGEMKTVLEAAQAFGIGVFTSVPLMQSQLLPQVRHVQLPGLTTPAQTCLQFVRSTPGVLAPLVGHKQMAHVKENLAVASVPLLTPEEFDRTFGQPSREERTD